MELNLGPDSRSREGREHIRIASFMESTRRLDAN